MLIYQMISENRNMLLRISKKLRLDEEVVMTARQEVSF
jgi:hypothetical protein